MSGLTEPARCVTSTGASGTANFDPTVDAYRDPRRLRAIAHPLRLRILDVMALCGPLTATEVAALVGHSPANCSWHLRQLARYGFITEAGDGSGRRRPWRMAGEACRSGSDPKRSDPGFLTRSKGWCTAAELAEFEAGVAELVRRYLDRPVDAAGPPPGAQPVRFIAWMVSGTVPVDRSGGP
jgi:DNA-binding transcriptional ArsR family regulator